MTEALEIVGQHDEVLPEVQSVPASPTLFGTTDPAAVVQAAAAAAKPLADVVRAQKLSVKIGPSEHVRVEGWTLLGSMLGVFPICVWSRKVEGDDGGWEARVEARTRAGDLVGAAEAECLRSEKTWKNRDDYALRSMAQTRATSKALRQPLGFVMTLAGFNATPAEEMPRGAQGPDVDFELEAEIGELLGLSERLNCRAAVEAAIEDHRVNDPQFAQWVRSKLVSARGEAAKTDEPA